MIRVIFIAGSLFLLLGGFLIPRTSWAAPTEANRYLADIGEAERQNGLPLNLLARLLYQESRFRPDIIYGETKSNAGAIGIAQIIPRFHPTVDPYSPQDSIFYSAGYLRDQFDRFGSWEKALGAYNWGPTNVYRAVNARGDNWIGGAPGETKRYVQQIISDIPEAATA